LIGLIANLDETIETSKRHKAMHEILVFLEDLLQREQRPTQLASFRRKQFLCKEQ